MFEFEQSDRATGALLTHPTLDEKTRAEFGPERVRSHSLTNWGEHCTECVWPTCYTTCSFYQPRQDGRCRRFDFGIYRTATPATWMGYSACLKFRNWSMLWAQGNATQLPKIYTSFFKVLGEAAWSVSAPVDWLLYKVTGRKRVSLAIQSLRRRTIKQLGRMYDRYPKPDCFLLEVFNPMSIEARLNLRARGDKNGQKSRFEWTGHARSGMTSFAIPITEFERWIDLRQTFDLTLSIAEEEGKSLYFCSATFVRMADSQTPVLAEKATKIKCVVWDLDNTLWDGILVESGGKTPQLRDGVRTMIADLDRRGILLSIASKNSEEDARKVLETLGVWEYFLVPSINWQPKSESLKRIAKRLNLGLDSLAFVDDAPFERDEVAAALPMTMTIPADQCLTMLGRPEFAGDTNTEGGSRRLQYKIEMKREETHAASSLGYDAFLAMCGIRIKIKRPADSDLPRIQDIVQRTNQLNIATKRYEQEELRALLHSKTNDCYLVSCADNYGDYGQVGFITVELQERGILIRDCMFSCRIQGKRIDEAVLVHLINRYLKNGALAVRARFIPTKRNAPAGEMLTKLGFAPQSGVENVLCIADVLPRTEVESVTIESESA